MDGPGASWFWSRYDPPMPITEIVRVLATGRSHTATIDLFYDVDGRMGTDEEARARPFFWLRVRNSEVRILGPFFDELDALDEGESLGFTWD